MGIALAALFGMCALILVKISRRPAVPKTGAFEASPPPPYRSPPFLDDSGRLQRIHGPMVIDGESRPSTPIPPKPQLKPIELLTPLFASKKGPGPRF